MDAQGSPDQAVSALLSRLEVIGDRYVHLRMEARTDLPLHLCYGWNLFEQEQYHDAMEQLTFCHQIAEASEDYAGAFCAFRLLEASTSRLLESMELSEIYELFLECLTRIYSSGNRDNHSLLRNEARAWATFYIASTARSNGGMSRDVVVEWLQKSLHSARGVALIYEASKELGNAFLEMGEMQAETCFRVQSWAASRLRGQDPTVEALHNLFRAVVRSEELDEARVVIQDLYASDSEDSDDSEDSEDVYRRAIALQMHSELRFAVSQFHECASASLRCIELLKTIPARWFQPQWHDQLSSYMKTGVWDSCPPQRTIMVLRCIQSAWSRLRVARCSLGDYEGAAQADQHLQLVIAESTQDRPDSTGSLRFQASLHFSKGNFEEAEATVAQLLQLCSDQNSLAAPEVTKLFYADALTLVAKLVYSYRGGKLDEEGAMVVESLLIEAHNLYLSLKLQRGFPELGNLYYHSKQWSKAVENYEQYARHVVDLLEEKIGSFSSARISHADQDARRVFRRLQIALLELQPQQVRRAIVWAERERARDLIYGMKGRLLMFSSPESFSSAFDSNDDTAWEKIKSNCDSAGRNTLFIVFTCFDEKIISYLLHTGEEEAQCHRQDAPSLGDWVHDFQVLMAQKEKGDSVQKCLQELYKLLIQPWAKALEEIKPERLVIIPSEELSLVPFAALMDEDFLIQKYAISYAPSLRLFEQCEMRQEGSMRHRALVVGNPDGTLHSAEEEATLVVNKLKQTGAFQHVDHLQRPQQVDVFQHKAPSEAVLEALPNSDWIHIASHAIINEEFPYGAVLMEKLNQPLQSLDLEDRAGQFKDHNVLTGRQIETSAIQLRAVAVVLSACSTGLGRICAEGTLGLCRSLHATGVPTVVVSLWNVDDEATKVLMEHFYTELCKGVEIAMALQMAMKHMTTEDDWGYPQYSVYEWAAFTLSGSISAKLLPSEGPRPQQHGQKLWFQH